MRRRILSVTVMAVLLAVTLFGAPLAVAVSRLIHSDERAELERAALRGAVAVSPDFATSHDPVELPNLGDSIHLALYGQDRRRAAGTGPRAADDSVVSAFAGSVANSETSGETVVAVPVTSAERVIAVVRASSARSEVTAKLLRAWAVLLGVALAAGAIAIGLAGRQTRRLAAPLEELEHVAEELGGGNFAVRSQPSGVAEIDRTGQALNRTAFRLGELHARERDFSAQASHQLRTPLTILRLHLEAALEESESELRVAAADALVAVDQLSQTIDDVLTLARRSETAVDPLDIAVVFDEAQRGWHGPLAAQGRRLRFVQNDPPESPALLPAVRQILGVLLDNAYRHGKGTVTVTARDADGALAIDVSDEGSTFGRDMLSGPSDAGASHIGLALAGAIAEAEGGRLLHARTETLTRFTLLLPADPV